MLHRIYQENKPAYIAVRAFSTDQIGYGPKRKSGIQRIATALGCDYYTVYRWLLPKSKKGRTENVCANFEAHLFAWVYKTILTMVNQKLEIVNKISQLVEERTFSLTKNYHTNTSSYGTPPPNGRQLSERVD
jgi:hypothetical protein